MNILFKIRKANRKDYLYCYSLTKKNMIGYFTKYWGGWNPRVFRNEFSYSNTHIIIINKKRYGFYTVKELSDHTYIENIQLSSTYHCKGIGSEVLNKIIHDETKGIIKLTTFVDNPALNLYKRYGFKTITNKNGVVLMKFSKS